MSHADVYRLTNQVAECVKSAAFAAVEGDMAGRDADLVEATERVAKMEEAVRARVLFLLEQSIKTHKDIDKQVGAYVRQKVEIMVNTALSDPHIQHLFKDAIVASLGAPEVLAAVASDVAKKAVTRLTERLLKAIG